MQTQIRQTEEKRPIPKAPAKKSSRSSKGPIVIPAGISDEVKPFYIEVLSEFQNMGINTTKFRRVLILLAKQCALEARIEAIVDNDEQGIYFENNLGRMVDHPMLRHLLAVRASIMTQLKACGLTPASAAVNSDSPQNSDSDFASLQ